MDAINRSRDEQTCFNTLFQWECKAMDIYGAAKVKGFFEYFRISLAEEYYISFAKPFEVKIEIARDLHAHEKILNDNKEPSADWIKKEIDSPIEILKDELKAILVIMKRSKRTHQISVFLKLGRKRYLQQLSFRTKNQSDNQFRDCNSDLFFEKI